MYWKNKHINFKEIPKDLYINFDWKEIDYKTLDFSKCKYLIIWHHQNKDKNFNNLPEISDLEYLEINWSSSISLKGLSKFKNIKRLELHYCTKIETLDGIEDLNKGIEYVHIDQSKKLIGHKRILELKNLTTLCFNACGSVPDVEFLLKLLDLKDFRFVDTNILNGDLTPIINHPKITNAGFLNKRHYSHKDLEIDSILATK